MAAKTSKALRNAGSSLVQETSLQALLPPASPPVLTLKDLQDALGKHAQLMSDMMDEKLKKLEEKLEEKMEKLEKKMEEKLRAMRVDILSKVESVAECVLQLDIKVEDLSQKNSILEAKVLENENIRDKMDEELSLVQYNQMQYAIRIRGLKENGKEDLKQLISEALEGVLGQSASEIEGNMDKVFRVNSWIARQRKLPRDVVVYFTKRVIRDEVIQAAYDTNLVVAEQEVLVLKEIPPKILRRRKDFAFLVQELKKRDIKFRWEIPVGLVATHEGKRHRLVTVAQARDFYSNVLKATPLSFLEAAKGYGVGKFQDVADRQTEDNGVGGDQATVSSVAAGGQKMTRAALRRAR
ncbi:uncharacterized protein M6D78_001018 [Vipera latastei]